MSIQYEEKLTQCAGYIHFRPDNETIGTILFLHGYSEAAKYNNENQCGPIRLLRHPLPAYFWPEELENVKGWHSEDDEWGLPPGNLCQQWQTHYELFAPQRRIAGAWTKDELVEVRDKILLKRERQRWHLAGTSFGGAGALRLIELCEKKKPFLSVGLACPKPDDALGRVLLPPVWTRYGKLDLSDVRNFCMKYKQKLAAEPMENRKHCYVCRHAFEQGKYFEWLQDLRLTDSPT